MIKEVGITQYLLSTRQDHSCCAKPLIPVDDHSALLTGFSHAGVTAAQAAKALFQFSQASVRVSRECERLIKSNTASKLTLYPEGVTASQDLAGKIVTLNQGGVP